MGLEGRVTMKGMKGGDLAARVGSPGLGVLGRGTAGCEWARIGELVKAAINRVQFPAEATVVRKGLSSRHFLTQKKAKTSLDHVLVGTKGAEVFWDGRGRWI